MFIKFVDRRRFLDFFVLTSISFSLSASGDAPKLAWFLRPMYSSIFEQRLCVFCWAGEHRDFVDKLAI